MAASSSRPSTASPFLGVGLAFFAIGVAGQPAFLAIGLAFIGAGIAQRGKGRTP